MITKNNVFVIVSHTIRMVYRSQLQNLHYFEILLFDSVQFET